MKFKMGDVATYDFDGSAYRVIVDYRNDPGGRGEYRVVRLTNPVNGHMYGPPHWVKSYLLKPGEFTYKRGVSVYRNNTAIGTTAERGCRCQCCIHTALPASVVNVDGTFVGDDIELP
jgi:hypothetical protein